MELMPINQITEEIKTLMMEARTTAALEINKQLLKTYWNIGRIIVEHEQEGNVRAQYGKRLLAELSKELTRELGRGFSKSNMFNMRAFYIAYSDFPDASGKMTWSHYCELLSVSDVDARKFYEKECANSDWSVRELKRQISTSLFERLLLSDGKANQETVLALSREGILMKEPQDIMKDPYVFEFLGTREEKPMLEKDLEAKLIRHIEDFLLELGRGFMFVGSQQRVTLGNRHYYVDMVFYNKILKAYVLIDLKIGQLEPEHIGQMNMYLNYYSAEVNDEGDQSPIGIVLCTDKHEVMAEFALGGLANNIFASRYTYYIPDKERLIHEVKALLQSEEAESE